MAISVAACSDVTAPTATLAEYALESVGGVPLPVQLLTDYDITVGVLSDVITLRSDSTFVEIARFQGQSNDATLTTVDSVAGTWSVSGTTLFLLTSGGQATRLSMSGNTLTQDFGNGVLLYRLK